MPNDSYFPTIDAETGEPTQTPIEAVHQEYKKGRIKFQAGTRLPVKLNGVEGDIPAEQYDEALKQGAEPNFDPNGAAKALVASIARTATLTGSDYVAKGAARLGATIRGENPDKAAKDAGDTLSALQADHPGIEVLGMGAGALLPSGVEGLVGKIGKAAHFFGGAEEAAQAASYAHKMEEAAQATSEAVRAEAQTGRLAGSALGNIMKYADPYQVVAAAGKIVENPLARLGLPTVGRVAGLGAEGAIIGGLGAIDESEIGDTPLTGETMLANMEHGALFGSTLGLVGAAGERILTGAGRLADRLQEAAQGGSGKDYIFGRKRWGTGSLGHFDLELGATPTETAEQAYNRLDKHASAEANRLDEIAREADPKFEGIKARDVMSDVEKAIAEKAPLIDVVGGRSEKLSQPILKELKEHLGLQIEPEAPILGTEKDIESLYNARRNAEGLPPEERLVEPKKPTELAIRKEAHKMAVESGLGGLTAKGSPEDYAAFQKGIVEEMGRTRDPKLGALVADPVRMKAAYGEHVAKRVSDLVTRAREKMSDQYGAEYKAFTNLKERYERLRGQAEKDITDSNNKKLFEHTHQLRSIRDNNANKTVSLEHAREFRKNLDKHIPYNRSKEAVLNANVELKHAIRSAMENRIEQGFEKAAQKGDAEALGKYLHSKSRYGMIKDIQRRYERSIGAEARSFGKIGGFGMGSHLMYAAAGSLLGHPGAGLAVGGVAALGKKYASRTAAYLTHKAAKIAELKALRTELEMSADRGAKAALNPAAKPTNYATIKVPDLPPHEMRLTAAKAMESVAKMANKQKLSAHLAMLDPGTSVIAPRAAQAHESSALRAAMFLATRIPANVQSKIQSGQEVSAEDLTATDAHNFLHEAAAAQDPRVALDATTRGQLTSGMAVAYKTAFPAHSAYLSATLRRGMAADKNALKMLSPGRQFSIKLLTGDDNPGLTVALQGNLVKQYAAATTPGPQGQGGGMSHASFGKSHGVLGSIVATQSQSIEAGPPGRRGRKGNLSL